MSQVFFLLFHFDVINSHYPSESLYTLYKAYSIVTSPTCMMSLAVEVSLQILIPTSMPWLPLTYTYIYPFKHACTFYQAMDPENKELKSMTLNSKSTGINEGT